MENRAVITLPLSPTRSNQFARFVTPIVGEVISRGINGTFYLCTNMLDSFNNRGKDLEDYKEKLVNHGIDYDELWIDIEHIDELFQAIDRLITLGYIYKMDEEVYRCDCGIIEIAKKNIATLNPNKRDFFYDGQKLICKNCMGECKLYHENVLVFDPSGVGNPNLKFYPNFLNKDVKTFDATVRSSYHVISRNRNTGISILYNGETYMLDVDFVWEVYLSLFPEQEKVVICGNKEIYQLYMTGIIERCLNRNAKTLFIGTPIINGVNESYYETVSEENILNDILTRKLAIILNISWKTKVKDYDMKLLDKLKRMPYTRKLAIYNAICNPKIDGKDFYDIMQEVLRWQFNYQEITKSLKRSKKNV